MPPSIWHRGNTKPLTAPCARCTAPPHTCVYHSGIEELNGGNPNGVPYFILLNCLGKPLGDRDTQPFGQQPVCRELPSSPVLAQLPCSLWRPAVQLRDLQPGGRRNYLKFHLVEALAVVVAGRHHVAVDDLHTKWSGKGRCARNTSQHMPAAVDGWKNATRFARRRHPATRTVCIT